MKILITGSKGFIGKNLRLALTEVGNYEILTFDRGDAPDLLVKLVHQSDYVVHLAGENRPIDPKCFQEGNVDLTQVLCQAIEKTGRLIPLIYSSSLQANDSKSLYAQSKRSAEAVIKALSESTKNPVLIYRLANVFGKWIRPNYNSVVGTFCYKIARGLPIQIHDENTVIQLIYIDDVIKDIIAHIKRSWSGSNIGEISPRYAITVGDLAKQLYEFKNSRDSLIIPRVGVGFIRALYSTYISYLPVEEFSYAVPKYGDERGDFVEMLKTPDAGQFSYFTALPGVTRGGHYHHSKTEKFLVISGRARFGFRHMITGEVYELFSSGDKPEIVETIPGWTHDITNIGNEKMVVMLWANEIYNRELPDTIASKV
ncbi:UDP-2-acetamido-2,6-beta-L-arabino-hexul-4-ose reductase [Polynucleobacter antarcticus]|uniref:Capsular biosynthesis protein n=1 Tax=Polynucleobacter antarcticus TaxID=1743162 RepID=A0A6M9PID2_9BURK|nr:NAD-dependent epimerase/dehydratase family protein [Polynucleobacter antarcticus]QKM61914.1 capsular biosynthesis protein [Polynucleobacter antarcticus]